ncbi:MAG: hypothetical protein AAFX10_00215 [Pseudomonadota bacterium]
MADDDEIEKSATWDMGDLSHRFTISFFASEYREDPKFIKRSKNRRNDELAYYNIAAADNDTNATICAGLLVTYVQAQGIPYHSGKDRAGCFKTLTEHLKKANGKVLYTADIVDHYFRFLGE